MVGTVALNLRTWVAPETVRPQQFEGACIDARGGNWSEQDLGEQDLRNANLCRCDLRGSNLSRCQLEGADLRLARFDSATTVPKGFQPAGGLENQLRPSAMTAPPCSARLSRAAFQ